MDIAIYIATGVLFCLGAFIVYRTYLERKRASAKQQEISWVLLHLDRALAQLHSTDEEEVVAGLQSLSAFNDEETRRRALLRVVELSHSDNPRITREASFALKRLYWISEKRTGQELTFATKKRARV